MVAVVGDTDVEVVVKVWVTTGPVRRLDCVRLLMIRVCRLWYRTVGTRVD